ncbi:MAG TPA: hypothetical protein VFS94_12715 [Gemmatimonadales bacterium]|nr:hypothetical protein [Gemmatimonadales bacterium]
MKLMRDDARRWGAGVRWVLTLVPALLVACEAGDRPASASGPSSMADTAFAESTAVAAHLDSAWLDTAAPAAQVLALPDSVRDFEMALPLSVAIGRGESCLIAVADPSEVAVHYFSSPNRYAGSRFVGGRRRDALSDVGHAVIAADGVTYLNELGRRRLVAVDRTRDSVRVFQSDEMTASMPRIVALEPVAPNRLIENWMAPSIPVASGTWAEEELPLLRVIDSLGNYLGGLWRIADRPGQLLTHGLNQGVLARRGDTLWFAYAVSGQVLRGVLDTAQLPWSLRDTSRLILPRMYEPMPPQWFLSGAESDTIGTLGVDAQVSRLAVTEDGHLIVGQTISYPPRGNGRLHQPTSAVVVYDGAGHPVRGWRAGGRIRGLAAGGGLLAVIVDTGGDPQVRIHRMADVVPGRAASGPCTSEA